MRRRPTRRWPRWCDGAAAGAAWSGPHRHHQPQHERVRPDGHPHAPQGHQVPPSTERATRKPGIHREQVRRVRRIRHVRRVRCRCAVHACTGAPGARVRSPYRSSSSRPWLPGAAGPLRPTRSLHALRGPARFADIALARDSEILRALVPQRTTLASLLETHQAARARSGRPGQERGRRQFDLRRVRAGQPYRHRSLPRRPRPRVRVRDRRRSPRHRPAPRRQRPDRVRSRSSRRFPRRVEQVTVDGTISRATPSLIQAIDAAGERIELSLALADVFSGEIDFNSDLQPGDTFKILVERGIRRGRRRSPVMARCSPRSTSMPAARSARCDSRHPMASPATTMLDGRSLKRFFLKSPLKFEPRITSSFSRARRHPILNYTRAHNGVDYAAPPGAPVVAVAQRRGHVRGLDRRRRTHGQGAPRQRLRKRIPAPVGDCRGCAHGRRASVRASSSDGSARPGSPPDRTCTTACGATAST